MNVETVTPAVIAAAPKSAAIQMGGPASYGANGGSAGLAGRVCVAVNCVEKKRELTCCLAFMR